MNTTLRPPPAPSIGRSISDPAPIRRTRYHRTAFVRVCEVVGVAALAGTAYIYLTELSDKFAEVPYLGVGYALMSIACVISIVLIAMNDITGWVLGGVTAAATFVGFVLTRTTGLPGSSDDIGNWSEGIGTWSLVAEGIAVVLAAIVVGRHLRSRT